MSKVLIIAEVGVNHNGDFSLAKKLIDKAAEAGADIVKFQTFKTENLVTANAEKAQYQKENNPESATQFEMLKALELSEDDFKALKDYTEEKGLRFLSTGFDLESLNFLSNLGMELWKIPSGEITNRPYLEFIGKQNKLTVLSTGMSTLDEIGEAIKVLTQSGLAKDNLIVLHCTTDYPCAFGDVNLNAMQTLAAEFGVRIGYSDHTEGVEVSVAAVALGAEVVEKHFTLDKEMEGPDHKASLNPDELNQLVKSIRNIEEAMGSSEKTPTPREIENSKVARKSIVAKCDISEGDLLSESNLTTKRPGTGISPMKLNEVYGTTAQRNFAKDELIEI